MTNPDYFKKYLGKERYYHDFLVFWQNEIEKKGWENVLNEFVFSGTEPADDLLTRLYAGGCISTSLTHFKVLIHSYRFPPPIDPPRLRNRVQTARNNR